MATRKKSGSKSPDKKSKNYRIELAANARAAKLATKPFDPTEARPGRRLIDKKQVLAKVPYSIVKINKLIKADLFPAPRRPPLLGNKNLWWEDEVDAARHKLLCQE